MAEACSKFCYLIISKKFQPNFKFIINEKSPTFNNYALGSHFKSEFCPCTVDNEKMNLPFIDSSRGTVKPIFSSQKSFGVPCILTCFKYLNSKDVKESGDLFDKRKLALTYSSPLVATDLGFLDFTAFKKQYRLYCYFLQHNLTKNFQQVKSPVKNLLLLGDRNKLRKQLHLPAPSSTSIKFAIVSATVSKKRIESRHVQIDEMNTKNLGRFESLINGPHSAAFSRKIWTFWQVDMENLM